MHLCHLTVRVVDQEAAANSLFWIIAQKIDALVHARNHEYPYYGSPTQDLPSSSRMPDRYLFSFWARD